MQHSQRKKEKKKIEKKNTNNKDCFTLSLWLPSSIQFCSVSSSVSLFLSFHGADFPFVSGMSIRSTTGSCHCYCNPAREQRVSVNYFPFLHWKRRQELICVYASLHTHFYDFWNVWSEIKIYACVLCRSVYVTPIRIYMLNFKINYFKIWKLYCLMHVVSLCVKLKNTHLSSLFIKNAWI